MKLILILALIAVGSTAFAADSVRGHTRKDGTYVQPHMRTEPNQYKFDNYSSQGNVNPYTGQAGSQRNEFSNPPSYNQSYGNPSGNRQNNRGY